MTVPVIPPTTTTDAPAATVGTAPAPTVTAYPLGTTTIAPIAAPAPVAAPTTEPPAQAADDSKRELPDDPEALKAEIAKLRRENAGDRTTAKANAAEAARNEMAQALGKVLGLVKDDEPVDPVKLTEQLTEQKSAATQSARELAVFRAASAVGGDPNALLDSVSFMRSLAAVDANDAAAITEAIKSAVTANPALGVVPARRLPGTNPAQGSSANGAPDLESQIAAARKAGDITTVIHLENQKLATAPR